MGIVRDLYPSERTPKAMLGGGRDVFKDLPACFWEAALENFQWPWPPLPQETLAKLDALQPEMAIQEDAAKEYINSRTPTVVPFKASIGLPLAIIFILVVVLAICAKAMV